MLLWSFKRYYGKQVSQYTIETLVGQGRYGVCFLAKSADGEPVVIKKFRPGIFKKNKEKNIYEAVILSKLKDPRIPELLGVVSQKHFYGFVLEWKRGKTLKDMIFRDRHKFSPEELYHIGGCLIQIIRYLHENGVVHRDIRIPNVLVDGKDVYLIDFGLARWADQQLYRYDLDFSYLGDLFLYLLYSSYERSAARKKRPWYEELALADEQKCFLKKLFGLQTPYQTITEIEAAFDRAFGNKTG